MSTGSISIFISRIPSEQIFMQFMEEGKQHLVNEEFTKALTAYQEAIQYAVEPEEFGSCHLALAACSTELKKWDDALKYYDQALLNLANCPENLYAEITHSKGSAYFMKGDFKQAMVHYRQALQFLEPTPDHPEIPDIKNSIKKLETTVTALIFYIFAKRYFLKPT
jgi:tetratricopeptide (TPR) repeat protein